MGNKLVLLARLTFERVDVRQTVILGANRNYLQSLHKTYADFRTDFPVLILVAEAVVLNHGFL